MFPLRKPNVLFAFLEMRFMCVSHDRSEEMSTPYETYKGPYICSLDRVVMSKLGTLAGPFYNFYKT